jgi:hypothetical protein
MEDYIEARRDEVRGIYEEYLGRRPSEGLSDMELAAEVENCARRNGDWDNLGKCLDFIKSTSGVDIKDVHSLPAGC